MDDRTSQPLHKLSGLYLESTPDERFGVLPGEERPVREVMSPKVVTVSPSASLKDAAELMRQRQMAALVVTHNQRLAGIVTEHDLVMHGLTQDLPPAKVSIQRILETRTTTSCQESAILHDAMRLMADHRLQSIPVVNGVGTVVGVLTLLDVASAVMPHVAATWLASLRQDTEPQQPAAAQ